MFPGDSGQWGYDEAADALIMIALGENEPSRDRFVVEIGDRIRNSRK